MHRLLTTVTLWLLTVPCLAQAADKPAPPQIVEVQKIWSAGNHNAFTDLVRWQDRFWCVFREAKGHVGGDGVIRVLTSADGTAWTSAAALSEPGIDLRDPKICITPDNLLMITMGGSVYRGTKTLQGRQPRVSFSLDGRSWTGTLPVLQDGEWLWRVTWHKGKAWGVSYRTQPRQARTLENGTSVPATDLLASLYSSDDGLHWQLAADLQIDGRPNEATVRFEDDRMLILIRREAGDKRAWLGSAKPPYKTWNWQATAHQLGGPNFLQFPDGQWYAAGRRYPGGARTVLFRLSNNDIAPILTLPSGGDTSYPGMVWFNDQLWMSYYSSHEGRSSIYMARIQL